ncbi:MAG: hypothetical protein ABIE84_05345, partial [bacterium]
RKGKVPIRMVMRRAIGAFCTGTAAVVSPIRSIVFGKKVKSFESESVRINEEELTGVHPVTYKVYSALTGIQEGRLDDVVALGLSREVVEGFHSKWVRVIKSADQDKDKA